MKSEIFVISLFLKNGISTLNFLSPTTAIRLFFLPQINPRIFELYISIFWNFSFLKPSVMTRSYFFPVDSPVAKKKSSDFLSGNLFNLTAVSFSVKTATASQPALKISSESLPFLSNCILPEACFITATLNPFFLVRE